MAVFVAWQKRVLLHQHAKLGLFLPPGGHIEPNELPDNAATRETLEETGISVQLIGELAPKSTQPNAPKPLIRPRGVQLEQISVGHEHIDLVYFAKPLEPFDGRALEPFFWATMADLETLPASEEIKLWCQLIFMELA